MEKAVFMGEVGKLHWCEYIYELLYIKALKAMHAVVRTKFDLGGESERQNWRVEMALFSISSHENQTYDYETKLHIYSMPESEGLKYTWQNFTDGIFIKLFELHWCILNMHSIDWLESPSAK